MEAGGVHGVAITIAPRAVAFLAFCSSSFQLRSGAIRSRIMLRPIVPGPLLNRVFISASVSWPSQALAPPKPRIVCLTPERSTDAVAARSPGGYTEAIVSAVMTNAHIRARVKHCSQVLMTRPFLSVGVFAVQGRAPLEVPLQRGGAGVRLHFRNRDRVDADGWIILSVRWSAPLLSKDLAIKER